MLIDTTYFLDGYRQIQNATSVHDELRPDNQAVNASINAYIARYQGVFLDKAVGKVFAQSLLAYAELDEAERTDEEMNYILDAIREPLADFVYYKIVRDAGEYTTKTGVIRLKGANTALSPVMRQVTAWNEMVDKMQAIVAEVVAYTVEIVVESDLLTKIHYSGI